MTDRFSYDRYDGMEREPDGEWVRASDYDAIVARLAEAERLLRPFAALSQPHQDWLKDEQPLFGINSALVLLGDVRAAAAFLGTTGSAEPVACPKCGWAMLCRCTDSTVTGAP
jgi:hypothetical protein